MFKPMDPDLIRKLIEGQPDVISQEAKAEEALYKNVECPMCGQMECEKKIRAPKVVDVGDGPVLAVSPFVEGKALPQGYAHCIHCGTDFSPRTGVIMQTEASMIHAPPGDLPPE